jgi:6-phosphogluconolactonase
MIDSQGKKQGAVGAFAIDVSTGDLKPLNKQASGGAGPCHVVVDQAGKNVLVANYGGGSVASLPIESDGSLAVAKSVVQHTGSSVDKSRQAAPHAHSINLDAGNRFAFAADLGLDKVMVYKFDPAAGTLSANDPPAGVVDPGSGPRHFAFHPNGKFAYVINEMALTVTAFAYDAERGALTALQTISTVPEGAERKGASTAEVQVHPSGKFLYGFESRSQHDRSVSD